MENSIEQDNDKFTPTSVTVPWWQQPAPRLHGTDSDAHHIGYKSEFWVGSQYDVLLIPNPCCNGVLHNGRQR